MLSKLPINKNQLSIAAIVLLLLVCYKLAFRNTFEAWQINKKLKSQITQINDVSYQPDYLTRKKHNLEKIIETYKVDTISFRSKCINKVALIAAKENAKLSDVPAPNLSLNTDKLIIQKISLEGNYFSLIKVLNAIQKAQGIGIVRSATLKVVRNQNGRSDRLVADVLLQIAK